MSLIYDDISKIRVSASDDLNASTINAALTSLVGNDGSAIPHTTETPGIWECRWYNCPDDQTQFYGKGDAVWMNTEPLDEFIIRRESEIISYVSNNSATSGKYEQLRRDGDRAAMMRFYRQVVQTGFGGNPPLYCVGDIEKPAQIRVSLLDRNSLPPIDSNLSTAQKPDGAWANFFSFQTEAQVVEAIEDRLSSCIADRAAEHAREYHLSGLSAASDFVGKYLKKDMSNAVEGQKFKSYYWYDSRLKPGFDSVKKFVSIRSGTGRKWFRLWTSGYLEHGGIVCGSDAAGLGDSIDNFVYTVRLDWEYSGGRKAKVYEYITDALNQFYYIDHNIDVGRSNSSSVSEYRFGDSKMGAKYRYSVSLCPVAGEDSRFDVISDDKYRYIASREVFDLHNDRFSFIMNSNTQIYSYHVSGFLKPVS